MNEKDIRDRIGQFLKKTARTVVVPASVGLGLSSGACNGNGIKQAGDAGLDSGTKQVDAAQVDAARTGPDQPDAAIKYDIPLMMVPYVVAMPPDAASDLPAVMPPYLAPPPHDADTVWKLDAPRADADSDARTDARPDLAAVEVSRPETYFDAVRAEIPFPPPPYLAPPPPPAPTGDASPSSPDKK